MGKFTQFIDISSRDYCQLGMFISAISNLTEALSSLKSDENYVLRQRDVINF